MVAVSCCVDPEFKLTVKGERVMVVRTGVADIDCTLIESTYIVSSTWFALADVVGWMLGLYASAHQESGAQLLK